MPTTPWIYRSPALAERIESLQVAPHSFDQATIEARASYVFTAHDPHEEPEQCGCVVTLIPNLRCESDYTLADGPVSASSDGVDVALSPRPVADAWAVLVRQHLSHRGAPREEGERDDEAAAQDQVVR